MIGERMDALAHELAATVSACAKTPCGRVSSSRSARRSTSTRCSPAAPRQRCRSTASPGRRSRRASTGSPLSAAAGLAAGAAETRAGAVGGPPDGSRVRAVGISYHYPADERATATCGPRSPCRSSRGGRAARLPHRLRPQRGSAGRGRRLPDARGDRRRIRGRRSRWRACDATHRPALGARPPDRARHRQAAPRDAGARGRASTSARPPAGRLRASTSTTSSRRTPGSGSSTATRSSSTSPRRCATCSGPTTSPTAAAGTSSR